LKINIITPTEWHEFVTEPQTLLDRIADEVFIVRGFMTDEEIDAFKQFCLSFSRAQPASWHPCLDDCPDYHRIHHQYPQAYVRSTQHGFYFHPWNGNFGTLVGQDKFEEIFLFKAKAANMNLSELMSNIPSTGPVARVVSHHYPKGGGGQEEHIDPVSPFALVQTLILGAQRGKDYRSGGLYIRHPEFGIVEVDALTRKGDLVLASPGVHHGVAPIDADEDLQWDNPEGRWIIMPIIINSDHVKDPETKPKRVVAA
jgi:hypothetical protein